MKVKFPYFRTIFLLVAFVFGGIVWQTKVRHTQGKTHPTQSSNAMIINLKQKDEDLLARNIHLYGYASISPASEVVAGSWDTWTITYRVGRLGIDDGGQILILTQAACDWGPFQMEKPMGENYTTVHTTGKARLAAHFDPRHAYQRPWWRGIVITIKDGYLQKDDEVIVTLGDRSKGGPGSRAQTFDQEIFEFRVMVDAFATGQPVQVLASPRLHIVGGEATKLEALWPTEISLKDSPWLLVRAKDFWGNPSPSYRGTIQFFLSIDITGLPEIYTFTEADQGFHRFEGLRVRKPGIHRIRVEDEVRPELSAETNPLKAVTKSDFHPYWGDLHGQTGETIGLGTVDSYFGYARGFAGADFASHQANDFQLTTESWEAIKVATKKYNQPDRFITFLGYEWSGTTGNGGDHNVIYLDDDQPIYRSSHAQIAEKQNLATDRYTIRDLTSILPLKKAILIPHIGGRRANLNFYQPEFMPVIEIYSDHGQFEWFLKEALARNLKVGFVANSDDHLGNPADSIPGADLFAVHGGLTCIYARRLSREDLWDALYKRRVYATTDERIWLRFQAGTHWMGEEVSSEAPISFSVEAAGTAGIERIDLFRGLEKVYRYSGALGESLSRIKVIWSGARNKQRSRQAIWDGRLVLSKGRFLNVQAYRFDYPSEGIKHWDLHQIIWHSFTSGDEDGLILDVEAPKNAVLTFETKNAKFSVNLSELTGKDWVFPGGGLGRKVIIRRAAETYPKEIRFIWKENELPSGTSAYWARLLQEDGAVAWSSPIFVTHLSKN